MKVVDFRCDHHRPTPAATADIDADGVGRQFAPRKDLEVRLEYGLAVDCRKFGFALPKSRPFMTEPGRNVGINVSRDVVHRKSFRTLNAQNEPVSMQAEGVGQAAQGGATGLRIPPESKDCVQASQRKGGLNGKAGLRLSEAE